VGVNCGAVHPFALFVNVFSLRLAAGIIQCGGGLKGMSSFLTFLATPAIKQVSKRTIFGKPYTRIGSLFGVVGFWVYQEGGVLGYFLRDTPKLLAKLAVPPGITAVNEKQIIKEIKESSSIVESELKEVEDEEKTFFHLYTVRELRDIGIDLLRWPPDKNLNKKANAEFAGNVMRISFIEGIAFGLNFPEQFAIYWDNTYRIVPGSKWQELRQRGIVLSKMQHKLTLNEAIVEIAEGAIIWGTNQSPNILDTNDICVLQAIIEANKKG
jgi:hypothetical protein